MRVALTVLLVVMLLGCTSTTGGPIGQPVASTTPSAPPAASFAVMVHRAGVGEPYFVQLVGFDGRGGPWVKAISRTDKTFYFSTPCPPNAMCADGETAAYSMPETSISLTHVYFLDGETQVKAMDATGVVTSVKNIDAPPNSQVMFSVSPNDRRLAVSIVTLAVNRQPASSFADHMYVEDLTSTANRVDLYSSSTLAEWPVAWHGGALVVATGSSDLASYDQAYGATGYVLVDPATGRALVTLDCAQGLLVLAGTACVTGGCPVANSCTDATLYRQAWDGTKSQFALPSGPARRIFTAFSYTHLSPDGTRVAADVVADPQTGSTETAVIEDGAVVFTTLVGAPQGWLDNHHLVVSNADVVFIIDLRSGAEVPMVDLMLIPNQGMPTLAGIMPEALG
jgi:hypothetical protein